MNNKHRQDDLAPLVPLRVETALSRFPVHRLAKQGTVPIEIRETIADGELALRWEVSYNSRYGQPGPLAYKLDTLVVNCRIEAAGRPIPRYIRLGSLKEIARELDLGGDTTLVKRALLQNAFAAITARIKYRSTDGAERELDANFTRYEVHFAGERLPDGWEADAVYLALGETYRRILDTALTRPLNYAYLRNLAPLAQRWYEVASYRVYAALKHHWPRVRLSYAEFCVYAPQTRYTGLGPVRKQMGKVHAPHLMAGYIAEVAFEATTDHEGRADWTMIYTPGPKAKAEYQAFARKERPIVLDVTPTPSRPEPELKVEPEPTGLERELVEHGVTRGVAAELVTTYPEERLRAQIERLDWLRETKPKRVKDRGAYLVEAIREDYAPPAGFASPADRDQREAIARAQEEQARQAKAHEREIQAREEEIRKQIAAYWTALSAEQQAEIEAAALAEAAPEQRQVYEAARLPSFRRTYLQTLRQEHLRRLLDLPVSG